MEALNELFTRAGTTLEAVTGLSVLVYGIVAALRAKIPGGGMKGWRSDVVALATSFGLATQMVPDGNIVGIMVTGLGGWLIPLLTQQTLKGTSLEIARNGSKKTGG